MAQENRWGGEAGGGGRIAKTQNSVKEREKERTPELKGF